MTIQEQLNLGHKRLFHRPHWCTNILERCHEEIMKPGIPEEEKYAIMEIQQHIRRAANKFVTEYELQPREPKSL